MALILLNHPSVGFTYCLFISFHKNLTFDPTAATYCETTSVCVGVYHISLYLYTSYLPSLYTSRSTTNLLHYVGRVGGARAPEWLERALAILLTC